MISVGWIALGGAFGAVLRYGFANGVYAWLGRGFPYGTLAVNVLGSFLIGVFTVWFMQREWIPLPLARGLIVGVLGAFTTFSTFSLDTLLLLEQGSLWRAGLNIIVSVGACLVATWVGLIVARSIV